MSNKTRHPLSTIQEYRGIVHMMPYGSLNGPAGHAWMLFYRCATCFELDITMSNIEGTPFATKIAPYMVEPTTIEERRKHLHKLTEKKSLIINHIFPALDELAPHHAREWTTLEDILSTPKYYLSLHKPDADNGEGDGDAVVRVDRGPIPTPAMDMLPARFDNSTLNIDPEYLATLPQIPASSITFPEPIDSNRVPRSVNTPTEHEVVPFIPAGRTIRNMDADRITNPSHFAIKTHLELHRLLSSQPASATRSICVQELLAVVTTESPPPETGKNKRDAFDEDQSAESPATSSSELTTYAHKSPQTQNAIYLAGILLKPLPANTKPLSDSSIISLVISKPSLRQQWQSALLKTFQFMHSRTPPLYHGGVSPYIILVCPTNSGEPKEEGDDDGGGSRNDGGEPKSCTGKEMLGKLYLEGFTDNHRGLRFIPYSETWTPQGDLTALENIFGDEGWLLAEMKKTKRELGQDYEWKREGLEADQLAVQQTKEAKRGSNRAKTQHAS